MKGACEWVNLQNFLIKAWPDEVFVKTFVFRLRKGIIEHIGPNYSMKKTHKIYATGLSELEMKMNHFFEHNPHIDILSIHSSRCITGLDFALGVSRKQVVFRIMYD